jgi:hypothetical protein
MPLGADQGVAGGSTPQPESQAPAEPARQPSALDMLRGVLGR